jgi:hypothetical protein
MDHAAGDAALLDVLLALPEASQLGNQAGGCGIGEEPSERMRIGARVSLSSGDLRRDQENGGSLAVERGRAQGHHGRGAGAGDQQEGKKDEPAADPRRAGTARGRARRRVCRPRHGRASR